MGLNSSGLLHAITSLSAKLGVFSKVNGHEPLAAADGALQISWWVESVNPVTELSGLAVSAARVGLRGRIEINADADDRNQIELAILAAADTLYTEIIGDFDLDTHAPDGEDLGVWAVDIHGAYGDQLSMASGYLRVGTSAERRIVSIMCPIVVKDVWTQS